MMSRLVLYLVLWAAVLELYLAVGLSYVVVADALCKTLFG